MAGRKRAPTSDLNHDNWDQEEEREEKGSMVVADTNTLESRNIIKAKRKSTGAAAASSPFAGLSLFGSRPLAPSSLATSGIGFGSFTLTPPQNVTTTSSWFNPNATPTFTSTGLFSNILGAGKLDASKNSNGVGTTQSVPTNNQSITESPTLNTTLNNSQVGQKNVAVSPTQQSYRDKNSDSLGDASNEDEDDEDEEEDDSVPQRKEYNDEDEEESTSNLVYEDEEVPNSTYDDEGDDIPNSSTKSENDLKDEGDNQSSESANSNQQPTPADSNDDPSLPPDDEDW